MLFRIIFENGYPSCEEEVEAEFDCSEDAEAWAGKHLEDYASTWDYIAADEYEEASYSGESFEEFMDNCYCECTFRVEEIGESE